MKAFVHMHNNIFLHKNYFPADETVINSYDSLTVIYIKRTDVAHRLSSPEPVFNPNVPGSTLKLDIYYTHDR